MLLSLLACGPTTFQGGRSPTTCESTAEQVAWYDDGDGDGFGDPGDVTYECAPPLGYVDNNLDCDDGNAGINPDAEELCTEVDRDCNGTPTPELPDDPYEDTELILPYGHVEGLKLCADEERKSDDDEYGLNGFGSVRYLSALIDEESPVYFRARDESGTTVAYRDSNSGAIHIEIPEEAVEVQFNRSYVNAEKCTCLSYEVWLDDEPTEVWE